MKSSRTYLFIKTLILHETRSQNFLLKMTLKMFYTFHEPYIYEFSSFQRESGLFFFVYQISSHDICFNVVNVLDFPSFPRHLFLLLHFLSLFFSHTLKKNREKRKQPLFKKPHSSFSNVVKTYFHAIGYKLLFLLVSLRKRKKLCMTKES